MNVVELRPERDAENIAKALRNIADDIEAGAYDFDPLTAVVVLAREDASVGRETETQTYRWQTHGLGKCSIFAARGILATAANRFDGLAE